jgi:hypothetical protein
LGGSGDNYTFSFVAGTFTVTKDDAIMDFDNHNPPALQVSAPGRSLDANALSLKVSFQEKQPDFWVSFLRMERSNGSSTIR